jgi:uncharacterized membrane protein YfcA
LSPLQAAAVFTAAAAAGAVNAVAGGGTLITFPALLAVGLGPVTANATSTVGLVPGSFGGTLGYRRELAGLGRTVLWLTLPSLVGGAFGAGLLLLTPPGVFARLVPFLILGATALFFFQDPIRRRLTRPGRPQSRLAVVVGQLAIAVYGGYFGAGIGILMLATLSLLDLGSIHRANAIKTLAAGLINGIAAGIFVATGNVVWTAAVIMIAGSTLGGFAGAGLARRIGERAVRGIVIAVGVIAAVSTGIQAFR